MKDYEQLTFIDDFFFCKILQENPSLCKDLAEVIVGRKIGEIVTVAKQLPVEITSDGKGVRFDVYFEDDRSSVYDIEMQVVLRKDLPKRSRYYQSMIDLELLNKGGKYSDLNKCTVIFICLEDLFGYDQFKYTFCNTCKEVPSLMLGDDTEKIFLNANGHAGDVSADLRAFLQYVTGRLSDNPLVNKLEAEVIEARLHKKWRAEYMTLLEKYEEQQEIGKEIGKEMGKEMGQDELADVINWLLDNGRSEDVSHLAQDKHYRKLVVSEYRESHADKT